MMELYEVMRSTFAAREFTADPLPDEVLYRILDNARFSPSGGNRQGAHIVVVRDATTREQLAELAVPGARRYVAQIQAGESPWNPLQPCSVAPTVVENTEVPDTFTAPFLRAAVVLVVSVDLSGASSEAAVPSTLRSRKQHVARESDHGRASLPSAVAGG
jgi:nitroreductase